MLPGLLVSLVSLAVIFYFVDFRQLAAALARADYRLVLVAVFTSLAWLAVRALAWQALLSDKAPYTQVFFTINEGYLLNNLLPFRLGEVGRAFLLSRKSPLHFWEIISSILIERALDLAMAAALLLITLPFVVGGDWAGQAALFAGALVLAGLLALYLLARNRRWAQSAFEKLAARWPLLQRLGGNALSSFFNGLGALTHGSVFLRSVGWILLDWLIALVQYYFILRAFIPGAQYLWSSFTLGVAALGIAAPSSPGAVGVYEISVVGALALFAVDSSTAFAFALTAHLMNYVITGLIGAYALARDGESLLGLYRRLRASKDAPHS